MKNFDNWLCRASSAHILATGNIGLTDIQELRIIELTNEKETGININGNKIKWTENKKKELEKLISERKNPNLPKTFTTELKKVFREVKYNRSFPMTNKYTEKGLRMEEESFTTYQNWLLEEKDIKVFLKNNKERISNDYFTGETDSHKSFHDIYKHGFDIKTSYTIETFPFQDDKLDMQYVHQNEVYMHLNGLERFKTVHVLVNSNEDTLQREKSIWFYATECHKSDDNQEKYENICRELEKKHIVDYDRFVLANPFHDLVYTRDEWYGLELDIPLKDRVIERETFRNNENFEFLKERVKLFRSELNKLE